MIHYTRYHFVFCMGMAFLYIYHGRRQFSYHDPWFSIVAVFASFAWFLMARQAYLAVKQREEPSVPDQQPHEAQQLDQRD